MGKFLLGVLLFIVLGLAGVVILVKTIDLNQYLPQIVETVSKAVGRDVTVGKLKLNLSLKQGVVVDVAQVSLSDDPLFSKTPFLSIDHVHVGVGVLPLITKRQIEIISIDIQALQVTMIRNAQGVFNYESMVQKKPQATADPSQASQFPAFPKLLVNSFTITDARIIYQDFSQPSAINLSMDDIDGNVTGFSLQDPFKIALAAAVFSQTQNLHLDAVSRIDVQLQQARFDDAHFRFDLAGMDMQRLVKEVPPVASLGIGKTLEGSIQAVISQMVVGIKGLLVLSLDGKIEGVRVPLNMLAVPIEGLNAKLDVTESRVKISDFGFNLSSGKVNGQLNVKDYLTVQDFDLDMTVNQLLMQDVIAQSQSSIKIKGDLSGKVRLKGQGFSPEAMDQVLGQAQLEISDAQLLNINIVKTILEKIPVLSSLKTMAGSQLSQTADDLLGENSTRINSAKVKARIEKSNVLLDDVQVNSDQFQLSAQGSVDFNQTVSMQAKLNLSQDMSASLIDSAGEMKALLDENKQLQFPVTISGKIPNLSYVPDVGYISKLLLVNKGGSEIKKVLEKNPKAQKFLDLLTGGGNEDASSEQPAQEEADPQEPSSGQQLLRNIFEKAL